LGRGKRDGSLRRHGSLHDGFRGERLELRLGDGLLGNDFIGGCRELALVLRNRLRLGFGLRWRREFIGSRWGLGLFDRRRRGLSLGGRPL